ncbi:NADAR family protein [bacterium]|nr:MAG: NADAR family protein [bacterium]
MAIYFYSTIDKYGVLSNFAGKGVEMEGEWWPTVEHYFQGQKFLDAAYREKIRIAPNPGRAKSLGSSRSIPLRADWEEVKDEIMYRACLKKFQTHPEPRALLLSTGDEKLVENAPGDYYWGCGKTATGLNKLGHILMRVRSELRDA